MAGIRPAHVRGSPASQLLPGLRLRRGRWPRQRRPRRGGHGRALRYATPHTTPVLGRRWAITQDSPGRRPGLHLAFPARPETPQWLLPGPRTGQAPRARLPERPARALQRERRRLVLSPGAAAPPPPGPPTHPAHTPTGRSRPAQRPGPGETPPAEETPDSGGAGGAQSTPQARTDPPGVGRPRLDLPGDEARGGATSRPTAAKGFEFTQLFLDNFGENGKIYIYINDIFKRNNEEKTNSFY